MVVAVVVYIAANECGAKSTKICANNKNRENTIYIDNIVVSLAAMRISSLSPLSIKTDSPNNFHMCTDKHNTTDSTQIHHLQIICMYMVYTECLNTLTLLTLDSRFSYVLANLNVLIVRLYMFCMRWIWKFLYGISILQKCTRNNILCVYINMHLYTLRYWLKMWRRRLHTFFFLDSSFFLFHRFHCSFLHCIFIVVVAAVAFYSLLCSSWRLLWLNDLRLLE